MPAHLRLYILDWGSPRYGHGACELAAWKRIREDIKLIFKCERKSTKTPNGPSTLHEVRLEKEELQAKCRWQKCNHKIRGTWIYNRSANRELSFRWPLADNDNVLLSSAMIASDLELGLELALGLGLGGVKGLRMHCKDKLAALLVVGGIYELKVPPL
ncbi:GD19513 [Drosophila simulans]|uniref:GD19513 n=1 Tax=Drosophila simulans TaxID=7240 RepID=B4QYY7_DROSI|nr:GD19513 [Drosophila simulans]